MINTKHIMGVSHNFSGWGGGNYTDLDIRIYGDIPFMVDIGDDVETLFYPSKVIIKCNHCEQWGAVKTTCKYCGAPIE